MPESVAPNIRNRSYTIAAEMESKTPEASGTPVVDLATEAHAAFARH